MIGVSIIIPTFGEPVFLKESINSVLEQTYQNWELIVVDDNNPNTPNRNKTEKLMDFFKGDNRIYYFKHSKNLNGAVARNTGITKASGKYIAFLDSDDEYMPDRIQKCYDLMEQQSNKTAGVYTGCEFRKGKKVFHVETNVKPGNHMVSTLACTFMFCTGSNIFVRKEVVDELNGFDRNFLRHQDYEFLVRVFEKYDIAAIPEVLVIKNNENYNLPNVEKMIDIKHQYLDKYSYIINTLSEEEKQYIYHHQWVSIAETAQRTKDYRIARKYYKIAAQFGGLTIKEQVRRILFRFIDR